MATMISLDCRHPDLEEFINLKTNLDICTKANISVRVSDEFMQAVITDRDWTLVFSTEHETIIKKVRARDIFMLLAKRNWEMAEPGILYWDTITRYNMLNTSNFNYAGVNPCAEEPLPAGGSCLLGSLNLSEFVVDAFHDNCHIDYDALEKAVAVSVQGLNQVLMEGMELHPLKIQRDSVYDWRQIGLGTMGLGDCLIKLGLTYGSKESTEFIDKLFKFIATTAVETSLQLAKFEGCFPMCDRKALVQSEFIKALDLPENTLKEIEHYGLFNSQLLTCAPTGSTATMLGVSTGVEPNFAFSYTRRTVSLNKEETYYQVDSDIVKQYKEVWGECDNKELPEFFIASHQVDPYNRLKVQAALQKWIDASISSTLNLKEETTVEEVFNIYVEAWKLGLKGITIWRDNCQRQGILSTEKKEEPKKEEVSPKIENKELQIANPHELKRGEVIKTSNNWLGLKRTLMTGCGSLHVNAYFDKDSGELRELYLSKGSTGGCQHYMIGLSRMISLAARGGLSVESILDQLKSCGSCSSYAVRSATKKDTSKGSCCPVAVGNALKDMYEEIQYYICECKGNRPIFADFLKYDNTPEKPKVIEPTTVILDECPNCHEKTLSHIGGCLQCPSCGYSKCD